MKLQVLNTAHGLVPLYDADYDEKKKLKIGETYDVTIKKARNIDLHRKYFSLIHTAWEYQNYRCTEHFHDDVDCFRKTIEVAAGWCEPCYNLDRREWIEIPKSIAFDKMDELEFRDLYERVKDVLFKFFLKNVTPEEFERNLINY